MAVVPLGKVTPASEPGPAKVTVTPETGLPYWSLTTTSREVVKAVPTVATCPVPDTSLMLAAAPGLTLMPVSFPLTDPTTVSVTVIDSVPAVSRTRPEKVFVPSSPVTNV